MIIMVNNTDERPLNPIAAKNWDLRQKIKANAQADEESRKAALKEVARASRDLGPETRGGLVESGIVRKAGSW